MQKKIGFMVMFLSMCVLIATTQASTVTLYVDAAPNIYGSPDYLGWQTSAFEQVADGSFINMFNGINPDNMGTTNFEIEDEVVYSFGDLGSRLTWLYYIEGETVESLTLSNSIQVSLTNVWDGELSDFYSDYYGSTWLTPKNIYNYIPTGGTSVSGVIGLAGMAYWGAYGVNTQEALDEDIANWGLAEEDWFFTVRLDGTEYSSIASHRDSTVPEPTTMLLFGFGLLGISGVSRKKRQ